MVSNPPIWRGEMYPLGATWDGEGVNFAVYSEPASYIEVCLFDEYGNERRFPLPEVTAFVHHGYIPGLQPGQKYGFRVHGPWKPTEGLVCNPDKLLMDPYAKAVTGEIKWGREVYGHVAGQPDVIDDIDSAAHMPKAVVIDPGFDWGNDTRPDTPLHRTVLYESHVKGMTYTHPDVPPELRGTYAGMVSEPILDHLVQLGVTAVELMPVHHFLSEHTVVERGLTNYWGYSTLAFFAPHGPYSSAGDTGAQVREFKSMVRAFHAEGIEVILDVVYNHTAEGNHLGPTLSLKGFDNPAYYRLLPEDPRHYIDFSGTGNSLNMRHSQTLQLMMDSLRYWITEMRVDGFRFDLAAALARGLHEVDRLSSFFDLIHQDPTVNQVKLIAEPWDVGMGGYQVGNFPPLWSEWNGKYRDEVRDYWRGLHVSRGEFATRFSGSSDLYGWTGRRPSASINFITAHDGFTLLDVVSYNEKHNEANQENNRDGESHNRSWNSGVEGPTTDPEVLTIRRTRRRSMICSLLLSQGVPMLLGGDEIGRTQDGNNNGYCQDSKISWYDWDQVDEEFLAFVRRLVRIRHQHPVFRRRRWFEGRPIWSHDIDDIGWFTPDGVEIPDDSWGPGNDLAFAVFLNGQAIASTGRKGQRIIDDSFVVLFNPRPEVTTFVVPKGLGGNQWLVEIDTADESDRGLRVQTCDSWEVDPWAMVVLRRLDDEQSPRNPTDRAPIEADREPWTEAPRLDSSPPGVGVGSPTKDVR